MNLKAATALAAFFTIGATSPRAQDLADQGAVQSPIQNTSAIFACPMTMAITSGLLDFPIITGAFEHRISDNGWSLFMPIHGAYNQHNDDIQYAAGLGLGLRKYIGNGFTGSYLTGQSDLLAFQVDKYEYTSSYMDENGIWHDGTDRNMPYKGYLSVTQLAYGYKWGWRQFTLDLSVGGAFYAQRDEKYTNVIAGANVGFPFNKRTFGFR